MADEEKTSGQGQDGGEQNPTSGQGQDGGEQKPTTEQLREGVTSALGGLNDKASQWWNQTTAAMKDHLPDGALSELQATLKGAGEKFDGIDENASLADKAKQGLGIIQDTAKSLASLAGKHLNASKEEGKEGEAQGRSGMGVNLGLVAASAATAYAGQKIATGKDGQEVGTMRKVFGRVLQVVAAAVTVVATLGLAQGKSGMDVAGGWRDKISNKSQDTGQGRTA